MISKTIFNFWLDFLLLILYSVLLWATLIVRFVFPSGVDSAGWLLWGRDYEWWMSFQFVTVCILTLAILLHVMMHWSWVCGVISKRLAKSKSQPDDGIRTLWGVGLLIVILHLIGAGMAAAVLMVESPAVS
ncbi:MAG: hypothetical protein MI757_09600 [Pirellulales bacterium]|nr:hypothetical protein [Pirellulales bacterium]